MALEDTRRSIWHAFTALARGEDGMVAKTRLKVLTNNIGRALGKEKAEEIIEDAEDSLTFAKYYSLIEPSLLRPDTNEELLTPTLTAAIDKICWMLCEGYYRKNTDLTPSSTKDKSDDLFKLWKVFNFLAKTDLESQLDGITWVAALPIRVDVEEAYRTGSLIRQAIGYDASECPAVNPDADSTEKKFLCDFVQFVSIVATAATDLPADGFHHGISYVSEELLNDVIKKGYLDKFGNHVTNWKRRWFRLTALEMKYFTTDQERDLKGAIDVCREFRPESQKSGQHRQFRFKLHTAGKSFDLAASDLRSQNEWITALQKAAAHFGRVESFHKCELEEREKVRASRRDKIAEEEFGKMKMREAIKDRDKKLEDELQGRRQDKSQLKKREEELEAERQARLEVEARLAEEAAQREAEEIRRKELEEIKVMLEELLEQERQAKRDEEIVRSLQARLLEEETEKREELERLKAEQDQLLQQERSHRAGLERERQEQEALLNTTQEQLDRLAAERHMAEQKILEAEEKMRSAELGRHKMEERLRLHNMSTSIGLSRPKPLPNPDPFITHRGKGAFVEADFCKKASLEHRSQSADSDDRHSDSDAVRSEDGGSSAHLQSSEKSRGEEAGDGRESQDHVSKRKTEEPEGEGQETEELETSEQRKENQQESTENNDDGDYVDIRISYDPNSDRLVHLK